jgi:hypothetical protein
MLSYTSAALHAARLSVIVAAVVLSAPRGFAQGCVAAKGCGLMPGNFSGAEANTWDVSVSHRYFKSDKHFTGGHEDVERQEEGSQVINRSHFTDVGITYTINDLYSVTATLPFVQHDRSQTVRNSQRVIIQRYSTQSAGLGDIRIIGNRWLWKPADTKAGNISVGLGVDLPTGDKDARDTFQVFDAATQKILGVNRTVDQSIQPGKGGYGIAFDLYAYRTLNPYFTAFFNGSYTATPQETNGVPTYRSNPFEAIMSIYDTYFARAGLDFMVPSVEGLSLSLAGRIEGVPVHDLIGGSDGFRRPGFSIAVEPGVSYAHKTWAVRLYVPVSVYRERSRSVPDKQQTAATGRYSHGDAAFADYLIMASISKRL